MLPHTHDRVGIVELPIEGMTDPTKETDGSYAGTLRCSKTASFLEMTLIVVKRTHPESFCRTGAVDTYVDDGAAPGDAVDRAH